MLFLQSSIASCFHSRTMRAGKPSQDKWPPLGLSNLSFFQHQYLMDSTYLPSISTLKRGVIRAEVISVLYKAPSFSHTWKSTRKAPHTSPQKEQMHTKTVFNHNKLCIYYAIRKSFTDSSLIVLSIQGIVTNCKELQWRHLARQWMLREMWTHLVTLRDARCARKLVQTMS